MNQDERAQFAKEQEEEIEELEKHLPKVNYVGTNVLIKYQGFWHLDLFLKNAITFQRNFRARDTDLFICGIPKSGTTWLKALLFTLVNRVKHPINNLPHKHPLLSHNPHELVYGLENDVYDKAFDFHRPAHLNDLPSPRLFSTHLSYPCLPECIKTSDGCKIIYVTRNPLDMLVSFFHFISKNAKKLQGEDYSDPNLILGELFEHFCEGRLPFGPFFEHVLGYWQMSLERPDKVLFLKYEDLKDDSQFHLKRLAEFVGLPFTVQEETEGVINQIVDFCSIRNLQECEANKSGVLHYFEKSSFFRKGEVGDWANHFSPAIAERMNRLMQEKLQGTGLSFNLY